MLKVIHIVATNQLSGVERVAFDICYNLNSRYISNCIITSGTTLSNYYVERGVKSTNIDISKFNLRSLLTLREFIKRNGFNVIHAHDNRASIAASLSTIGLKVKIISHIHSEYPWLLKVYGKFVDLLFRSQYDINLACSRQVYEFNMIHSFKILKNYRYLNNCIDLGIIEKYNIVPKNVLKASLNLNSEYLVFGYIGRIVETKGLILLLESFNHFIKSSGLAYLILVGSGDLENYLKEYVKKNGIEQHVLFLGFKTDPYEYYNLIDVFFLLSKNEGLPISILEAIAFKALIVATPIAGLRDLIKNNVTGFLVREDDDAVEVGKLMFSISLKFPKRMVEDSLKNLVKNYNYRDYIDSLINIYSS